MATDHITDYTKFDSEDYLKRYYSELKTVPLYGDMYLKVMLWLHDAFATNRIKGQRLLDIGTGPTIHTVISASPHVDSVLLSDFAPQNIEILKLWLDGSLEHSYEKHFKYVVDLEGRGESPYDREISLRRKISGICHIDLHQGYPLAPSFFPKFDIITTGLCLVSAAQNDEMYEKMARRVADMLQTGGHLLLFSIDGAKFYEVGKYIYKGLDLDPDEVQNIWKDCGFEIIEWKQESAPVTDDNRSIVYYLLVAKKVKSL